MKKNIKCIFRSCLISVIILLVSGALIIGGFIFIITYEPHYTWFTNKRKEKMNKMFSITVNDNIELREYREFEFLTQRNSSLYLYTYDLEKFMEENINGTITEKYEGDDFKYIGEESQIVYVDVFENDKNYSITLNIRD